jgi:hypothetical protein
MELLKAVLTWENACIWLVRASALDPESSTPRAVIASTSAIAAGGVGIIGNVVVHPQFRRRGLGSLTTKTALAWLRQRKAESVLLDATDDGQPLYAHLGFVPLARSWHAKFWLAGLDQYQLVQMAGATQAAVCRAEDLSQVRALDMAAFGGDRTGLLALMLQQPQNWLVIARDADDEPTGYLMYGRLRDNLPHHAPPSIHLGPLVARDPAAAAALLVAMLQGDAPWRAALDAATHPEVEVRASVPGVAKEIIAFYQSLGPTLTEDDVLMQLDLTTNFVSSANLPGQVLPYPGDPGEVYAWLAPMCF